MKDFTGGAAVAPTDRTAASGASIIKCLATRKDFEGAVEDVFKNGGGGQLGGGGGRRNERQQSGQQRGGRSPVEVDGILVS